LTCGAEAGFFKEVCSDCDCSGTTTTNESDTEETEETEQHRLRQAEKSSEVDAIGDVDNGDSTKTNDPDPTDTQQEAMQEEEVAKISAKTKISRTFSIPLFVIAGLAAVYLVSFFGDLSDSSEKVSSTLNTVAESEPFWGGLGAVLGGIGWFFVLIAAFIIAGPVAIVIMAIFGIGLMASSASDNPEKRSTAAKVARGCGIAALWVSGLLCIAILIIFSGLG
jgi:hypothetical protein